MKMQNESRKETSPDYEDVVFVKDNYRVINGRQTKRYHKQYIVQRFEGGRYRNLTYHLNWNSISVRYTNLV